MEDTDPKSSASAPVAVQYVFLFFLLEVLPQFFLLVFTLHMLGSTSYMHLDLLSAREMIVSSSYMQMLFTFSLSNRMAHFTSAILAMLYCNASDSLRQVSASYSPLLPCHLLACCISSCHHAHLHHHVFKTCIRPGLLVPSVVRSEPRHTRTRPRHVRNIIL